VKYALMSQKRAYACKIRDVIGAVQVTGHVIMAPSKLLYYYFLLLLRCTIVRVFWNVIGPVRIVPN